MSWLTKLREMRSEAALTYKEISERAGIPYSTVEKLFKGRTNEPKLIMIHDIVRSMGRSLDELFDPDESAGAAEDREIIEMLAAIDTRGRELIYELIRHEFDRVSAERRVLPKRRSSFIFYDFPVSAGTGEYMDVSNGAIVYVDEAPPHGADYLLRVSGSSMEPSFHNGDIVYVQKAEYIEFGEIGIFSYAGNVYIKQYSSQGLRSLNPRYALIRGAADIMCLGRVIGKVSGKIYRD